MDLGGGGDDLHPFSAQAIAPATTVLFDVVLEVCRDFRWTIEQALGLPPRQFWGSVAHLAARRERQSAAAKDNPLAVLALLMG